MFYTKPEVMVLGNATEVIENLVKGETIAENQTADPAYDLDE